MSADRYSICPRCRKVANIERTKKEKEISRLYGKVSREEYEQKREKLSIEQHLDENMREDYGVYIEGDCFYLEYSAYCYDCEYKFEKRIKEKLEISLEE